MRLRSKRHQPSVGDMKSWHRAAYESRCFLVQLRVPYAVATLQKFTGEYAVCKVHTGPVTGPVNSFGVLRSRNASTLILSGGLAQHELHRGGPQCAMRSMAASDTQ